MAALDGIATLRSRTGQRRDPGGLEASPGGVPERERGARAGLVPGMIFWATKGSWAILDQGCFALSSFLLNIMLARWLAPPDYGAFTVAFSVFLVLGSVHFALLIEPMLVFGPGKYARRQAEYLHTLVLGHWIMLAPVSGLMLVSGSILALSRANALSAALKGFAFAGPLVLLTWLMRRMCYLRSEPRLAASGGCLHVALTVAGLCALYLGRWLSIPSALGLLVAASLITSLWLSRRLGVALFPLGPQAAFADVLRTHWGYGRWAVATIGLMSVPSESYFLLLPLWHGLGAAAGLRALVNLTMPLRNAHIALSVLILPALARLRGTPRFGRLISLATVLLVVASAAYWAPVAVFQHRLLGWVYGGRYEAGPAVLWALGLYLLVSPVADVLAGGLRARERPHLVFRANVFATAAALTVGLAGLIGWGVPGAAAGIALASAARAVAMLWYCRDGGEPGRVDLWSAAGVPAGGDGDD